MKIIFYDVEHGSCCHIISPNNTHILIDVGSKTNASIVEHIQKKYFTGRNGQIDELIITHPHEDHIYDLPKLRKLLPPRVLHRPKEAFDIVPTVNTQEHRDIAECANEMNRSYNVPVAPETAPTHEVVNGGVHFDILLPKSEWTTKDDLNTFSSIIVVTYRGYKFVLTGDNPSSILQKMVDSDHHEIKRKIANATVLLAPHHGRVNGFCPDFFYCVNPILTVVSDKSIEHETQEETARLYRGRGTRLNGRDRYVLTTRNEGTIAFELDDNSCVVSMGEEDY